MKMLEFFLAPHDYRATELFYMVLKKYDGNRSASLLQFMEAIQSVQNGSLILTQYDKQFKSKDLDTVPNRYTLYKITYIVQSKTTK